jgi:hypothetical protein
MSKKSKKNTEDIEDIEAEEYKEDIDELLDIANNISDDELYADVGKPEDIPAELEYNNDPDLQNKKPDIIYICVCKQKKIFKSGLLLKYKMIKDKYGEVRSRSGALIKILNISYKVKEPDEGWDEYYKWRDFYEKQCKDIIENQKDDLVNTEDIIKAIIPKKPEDVKKEVVIKVLREYVRIKHTMDNNYDPEVKSDCKNRIEAILKEWGEAIEYHCTEIDLEQIKLEFEQEEKESGYVG